MSAIPPAPLRRLLVLVVAGLMLALPVVSAAQARYVRLEGRVQWIAGNVLSLSVSDSPAIGIDLIQVAQSDYSGLGQGDWVIITGQLSDDYRRVLGISIQRGDPGFQAPKIRSHAISDDPDAPISADHYSGGSCLSRARRPGLERTCRLLFPPGPACTRRHDGAHARLETTGRTGPLLKAISDLAAGDGFTGEKVMEISKKFDTNFPAGH